MRITMINRLWMVSLLLMLLVGFGAVQAVSAETCPSTGKWPAGCTPAGQPATNGGGSQQGVPCPTTGAWPAGCNPALSPAAPASPTAQTGGIPCPATGSWPKGCDPTLKPAAEEDKNRPLTGIIKSEQLWGKGELHMKNGQTRDSAVFLTPVGQSVAAAVVYVRAGEEFSLKGIKDGTYNIFMTSGENWDSATNKFTTNPNYTKFDKPSVYETEWKKDSYRYRVITITLHPVKHGTASISAVPVADFPK